MAHINNAYWCRRQRAVHCVTVNGVVMSFEVCGVILGLLMLQCPRHVDAYAPSLSPWPWTGNTGQAWSTRVTSLPCVNGCIQEVAASVFALAINTGPKSMQLYWPWVGCSCYHGPSVKVRENLYHRILETFEILIRRNLQTETPSDVHFVATARRY